MRFMLFVLCLNSAWCFAQTTATIRIELNEHTVLGDIRVSDGSGLELWRTTDPAGVRREWKTRLRFSNSKKIERLYVFDNRLFVILRSAEDKTGLEFEEVSLTQKRSLSSKIGGVMLGLVGAASVAPGEIAIYALSTNDVRFVPFLKVIWPVYHVVGGPLTLTSAVACAALLFGTPPLRPVRHKPKHKIVLVNENSAGGIDDIIYRDQDGAEQSLNANVLAALI